LSFSESTWRRLFENEVQYINRLQRGDWLDLFGTNGFELVEEEDQETDISALNFAARYSRMPKKDLGCTVLRVLLKKCVGYGVVMSASNSASLATAEVFPN
jgi:hypothetical protein